MTYVKNTCSLDCELYWGLPSNTKEEYKENILNADKSLLNIINKAAEKKIDNKIFLAFVIKTLDNSKAEVNFDRLRSYSYETIKAAKLSNCKLGVHSYNHTLYKSMNNTEYETELTKIKKFVNENKEFKNIFVFPKNQIHGSGVNELSQIFNNIRLNSKSWLYRSINARYTFSKRLLRYLDSFLPIYEIFCSKKPEVNLDNCIVGTHFYRANLSGIFLKVHYIRLLLGCFLMRKMKKEMHLWSHPHNFNNKEKSIQYFIKVLERL